MSVILRGLLAFALAFAPALPAFAEPTPELPEGASEETPPEEVKVEPVKKIETPTEAPAKIGEAKPDVEPKRFLWGNFFLGAFGGALLGGAIGVLGSGGETEKIRSGGAVGAGIGLVAGGVLSVLLGATTPLPPKPPKVDVESALGRPVLALGPQGLRAAWSLDF